MISLATRRSGISRSRGTIPFAQTAGPCWDVTGCAANHEEWRGRQHRVSQTSRGIHTSVFNWPSRQGTPACGRGHLLHVGVAGAEGMCAANGLSHSCSQRRTNAQLLQTQLVNFAKEMGAVERPDLTSEVTHLLVGSTDSPKYKFVARERNDVAVLKPEWIDAVRQSWMQGGDTDIGALEEQYKMPAFFGLTICISGFTDSKSVQLESRIRGSD